MAIEMHGFVNAINSVSALLVTGAVLALIAFLIVVVVVKEMDLDDCERSERIRSAKYILTWLYIAFGAGLFYWLA